MLEILGSLAGSAFDYQSGKKRGKRQHARQRELMSYGKELDRKQMDWYKKDYLGSKLTPWELGGVTGSSAAGGSAPGAPMEQEGQIGSKFAQNMVDYANQRNQENINDATITMQNKISERQNKQQYLTALMQNERTTPREMRDLIGDYESFVEGSTSANIYGTNELGFRKEGNAINAAAQELQEEIFEWEKYNKTPSLVNMVLGKDRARKLADTGIKDEAMKAYEAVLDKLTKQYPEAVLELVETGKISRSNARKEVMSQLESVLNDLYNAAMRQRTSIPDPMSNEGAVP